MILEAALVQFLKNDSAIFNKVNSRIHPFSKRPQSDPLPAITYLRVSAPRSHSHDGPDGLVPARIQLDVLGEDYKEAKELADLVRILLDGFRGKMGEVEISGSFLDGDPDKFEEEVETDTVKMDFIIHYIE